MAGTAAATKIEGSAPFSFANSVSILNLTGRNLEVVFGADTGTASYSTAFGVQRSGAGNVFVPGTASVAGPSTGVGVRVAIGISQGTQLFLRTTENTPITAAATSPLIISFWA